MSSISPEDMLAYQIAASKISQTFPSTWVGGNGPSGPAYVPPDPNDDGPPQPQGRN